MTDSTDYVSVGRLERLEVQSLLAYGPSPASCVDHYWNAIRGPVCGMLKLIPYYAFKPENAKPTLISLQHAIDRKTGTWLQIKLLSSIGLDNSLFKNHAH